MNSDRRIPTTAPEFGLLAWLESTRVALPLKGVECRFDVTGAVASVELDQIYYQDAGRPLDCTYTFPLPAGAAVYRCELHVNGRVIRARVEATEDARRIYREQKAAGHRAALVETERENLFTLSLGNVQPGDLIVVRFAWFQVLDRAADGLRLHVPTCPGVRYIPGQPLLRSSSGTGTADDTDQVPDASRITPPRIDALHRDAAYFCIQGRMAASEVESGSVSSPSHAIVVREKAPEVKVELSSQGSVPDRDFVLTWREPIAATLVPRAWRWTDDRHTYALAQLRAPENVPVAESYSQDVYFLIDRSGSMNGQKWQRTCQALQAFVQLLGEQDRVWITLFETTFRDFAEAPLAAPLVLQDRGFQRMAAIGTGGGTELLPAARHVLDKIQAHSAERPAIVILITDGQVGNEAEIQAAFRRSPAVVVHTFGIDTAVNDAFLRGLARQQRGGCWLQTPNDDIAGTVASLGDRLRRPVLTRVSVSAPWETTGGALADLHAGEVAAIALRTELATSALSLSGRLADGREQIYSLETSLPGSEAVKLLWAKERIGALLDAGQTAQALTLAREFNLVCPGAAFIAWDEAEKVAVAEEAIVQPAMTVCRDAGRAAGGAMPILGKAMSAFPSSSGSMRARSNGQSILDRIAEPLSLATRLLELRAILSGLSRSKRWLEAVIASVSGKDADALRAAGELALAGTMAQELKDFVAQRPKYVRFQQAALPGLVAALKGTSAELLAWKAAVAAGSAPGRLIELLDRQQVPAEIADYLLAWVWESNLPNVDRWAKLRAFLASLDNLPFSEEAKQRAWSVFLAGATGLPGDVAPLVERWLRSPTAPDVTSNRQPSAVP